MLLRSPTSVRGGQFMRIGKRFVSGPGLRLDAFRVHGADPVLTIGDDVQVNDYVHIGCVERVEIGNHVLIASRVTILDHNHGVYGDEAAAEHESPDVPPSRRRLTQGQPVIIEDNVWLGENVTVLPGVTIGFGSVIGAGSVVTRSIPPKCVAVGSPARVVRKWNEVSRRWERVESAGGTRRAA